MQLKTLVSLLTALSCMTASVASVVFPANADILTVVDLTEEQTLALYGTTIQGSYNTGTDWRTCTFEYYGSSAEITQALYPTEYANGVLTHSIYYDYMGYTLQEMESLFSNNEFLFYRCKAPSPDATTSTDLQFDLSFNTDIQGIAYYRQIVMMAKYWDEATYYTHMPAWSNFGGTANVSYSASPVAFNGKGYNSSGAGYVSGFYQTNAFITDATTDSGSGSVRKRNYGTFACCDFYLQDIDSQTGQENTFSISGQRFFFNRAVAYPMWDTPLITPAELQQTGSSTPWNYYYIIAISTPRVTDGYVLPQPETTTPDYSGQLSDIYDGIGANTTLLQSILAKLDLIYQQMQANGSPSLTLTPAQTIPPTLQQYYSGIASGAPSVSAVNGAIGGASDFVPLGTILSSSGLGSLLGVLAGLCCAGWVLTRGRS